jgi:hypothetical protein
MYTPPRNPKPKPDRQRSGLYLPLWSVVLMVLVVLVIAGSIVFLVIQLGGPTDLSSSEPRIVIITAEASLQSNALVTPTAVDLITRQPAQTITLSGPTLAPTVTFTPTPAVIAIGGTVVVVGQGGVNVRSGPSRSESVVAVANQGDTFSVIGGPEEADGLTFWQLRSEDGVSGWAAEGDGAQTLLEVVP